MKFIWRIGTLIILIAAMLGLTCHAKPSSVETPSTVNVDKVVHTVLNKFHLSDHQKYYQLLVETAKVESHGKPNQISKGNYGIWQVRLSTAKELLEDLKKCKPDMFSTTMTWFDKNQSLSWNLQHNVYFGAAVCLVYYLDKNPTTKQLCTVHTRANLWKNKYNTAAGCGTTTRYIRRAIDPGDVNLKIDSKRLFKL